MAIFSKLSESKFTKGLLIVALGATGIMGGVVGFIFPIFIALISGGAIMFKISRAWSKKGSVRSQLNKLKDDIGLATTSENIKLCRTTQQTLEKEMKKLPSAKINSLVPYIFAGAAIAIGIATIFTGAIPIAIGIMVSGILTPFFLNRIENKIDDRNTLDKLHDTVKNDLKEKEKPSKQMNKQVDETPKQNVPQLSKVTPSTPPLPEDKIQAEGAPHFHQTQLKASRSHSQDLPGK